VPFPNVIALVQWIREQRAQHRVNVEQGAQGSEEAGQDANDNALPEDEDHALADRLDNELERLLTREDDWAARAIGGDLGLMKLVVLVVAVAPTELLRVLLIIFAFLRCFS
jgi:hypothetical protein